MKLSYAAQQGIASFIGVVSLWTLVAMWAGWLDPVFDAISR